MTATKGRPALSLAEIQATWAVLEQLLDEPGAVTPDGEPSPEIAAWLNENSLAEREKVDSYIVYLRHLEGQQKALESLAQQYANRAKTLKARREWLLGRIRAYMDERGQRELAGSVLPGFGYRKNGGERAVELLVEPAALPPEFQRVSVEADRTALRETMKAAGKDVLDWAGGGPIARLSEQGESLRIL